jgi:TRAP-type C4-dicarboxylate transport system substrate-binding protein
MDGVRTGAVEMAAAGWGIYGGIEPCLNVVETPFLFNSMEAIASCTESFSELIDPVFQEKLNQKVLSCYTIGGFELVSKKPVKTLEEWDGLLVGCMGPPLANLTNTMGGAPIVIMFPDLYSSLEKGVIEATLIPPVGALWGKLPDICHHATMFYGSSPVMGYTINLDVWKDMPKKTQNIFLEEAKKSADIMNEFAFQEHEENINQLKASGVEVYILPKAERDRWEEKCQPYINEQLSSVGDFGQQVKEMADKANAKYQ